MHVQSLTHPFGAHPRFSKCSQEKKMNAAFFESPCLLHWDSSFSFCTDISYKIHGLDWIAGYQKVKLQ